MNYTKEQLAILAGLYAIMNTGKYIDSTYVKIDKTGEQQEIRFEEASEILLDMVYGKQIESEVQE